MVDYEAFDGGSFDAVDWVNAALQARAEGDSVDTHISTVVMKLQLQGADAEDAIEEAMTQMLAAVPRTGREIDRVEQSALSLKKDLGLVNAHLGRIEASTHASVDTLSKLHQAKLNMTATNATLEQAAAWSALTREARTMLEAGQLPAVAERLGGLQQSAEALRALPHADERRRELGALQAQLEGLLKPQLARALAADDEEALQQLVGLYRQLGRVDALKAEYAAARRAPLHELWRQFTATASALPSQPPGGGGPDGGAALAAEKDFVAWLPGFWAGVSQTLAADTRRASGVFGAAATAVLPALVVGVVTPLCASFAERLAEGEGGLSVTRVNGALRSCWRCRGACAAARGSWARWGGRRCASARRCCTVRRGWRPCGHCRTPCAATSRT